MRMRTTLPVVLVLIAACSDAAQHDTVFSPSFAKKPGGGSTVSDPTATWRIPNDPALALQGDGESLDGSVSVYSNGSCGVSTRVFATSAGSNSGDATIRLEAARGKGCGRTLVLTYPDGTSEAVRAFMNLRKLHNAFISTDSYQSIPVDHTELRTFAIDTDVLNVPSRCGRLLFGEGGQGNGAGSDELNVHRTSQNEFHVFSQSPDSEGNTRVKAWCERLQSHLDMPVSFTITADTDLQ